MTRRLRCARGHALVGANVYRKPNGRRRCRRCEADRQRTYRAENRAPRTEPRYLVVAHLRNQGLTNQAIADRLGMSVTAVRGSVENARRRGVQVRAIRRGWRAA